jgi:2-polyprenyl-6-methoxyphenol hydroxylase-like FAD-dependent oxidoreductase
MDENAVVACLEKLGKDSSGYAVARTEWVVDKAFESTAQFVVGADGHRSTVRRSLGIDFETVGPGQTFAVFEFTSDADVEHEMRIVFEAKRTSVLWPMGNGRFRWSFEVDVPAETLDPRVKSRLFVQVRDESYPYVSEEKFGELIAERAPWFGADVEELLWSGVIRFERKLAASFGRQRAWLVGDAAHLAAPAAIQSMNIGLREASLLTQQLGGVLRGSGPISSLSTYESKSVAEWQRLLAGVTAEETAENWVQSYSARIPSCVPASGDNLEVLLNGLGLRF